MVPHSSWEPSKSIQKLGLSASNTCKILLQSSKWVNTLIFSHGLLWNTQRQTTIVWCAIRLATTLSTVSGTIWKRSVFCFSSISRFGISPHNIGGPNFSEISVYLGFCWMDLFSIRTMHACGSNLICQNEMTIRIDWWYLIDMG